MHFLPDVYVECETCKGTRYNDDVLSIQFKGKNIAELEMVSSQIDEAFEGIYIDINETEVKQHLLKIIFHMLEIANEIRKSGTIMKMRKIYDAELMLRKSFWQI